MSIAYSFGKAGPPPSHLILSKHHLSSFNPYQNSLTGRLIRVLMKSIKASKLRGRNLLHIGKKMLAPLPSEDNLSL